MGNELRNVKLPAQALIAAIRRDDKVHVPGADDRIVLGDTLLIIGPGGIAESLRKLFVTK